MKKSDIIDTIECRKKIIEFFEYLEKGKEIAPEGIVEEIFSNILTDSSIEAYHSRYAGLASAFAQKNNIAELGDNTNSEEQFEKNMQILKRFNMICVLECVKSEVKENYCRIDAIIKNPSFANAVATGKIKATWSIPK